MLKRVRWPWYNTRTFNIYWIMNRTLKHIFARISASSQVRLTMAHHSTYRKELNNVMRCNKILCTFINVPSSTADTTVVNGQNSFLEPFPHLNNSQRMPKLLWSFKSKIIQFYMPKPQWTKRETHTSYSAHQLQRCTHHFHIELPFLQK